MSNDQQLNVKECDATTSTSYEEAYLEFVTVNMNQDNSHVSHIIPLKGQHLALLDNVLSKTLHVSEKEMNDVKDTKELRRAKLYIEKLRKKLDLSQKKYKRLQEKATSLAFLVKQLQDKKLQDKQLKEDI
ncbi:hypothetical protein DMN91_002064 [Ooceraea biroi]|uniref:Uncharacterized protein n=1 Tax=Ooceraea biroi TaxID=2015173 RepID=A0A026WAI8_OOCBI|nr:uncharacterized protein LOC105281637 [Ooceraea biroi]XP_011341301.1 uncharacterized protein LOC105281637 [Ooceraea biroi]XP_011341303.1 uncharacterized protein LOC105281637 [Ooceraea biroi]XP_011341304.1 uncharacterized protein LOC105281637 [Ooceraea biroi]EZA52661.1 hypothetical protein X777_07042 [Ooceraea biroi]RLU25902.1 hypothetical protein DMN91_002064 [Ooceraea biroi]